MGRALRHLNPGERTMRNTTKYGTSSIALALVWACSSSSTTDPGTRADGGSSGGPPASGQSDAGGDSAGEGEGGGGRSGGDSDGGQGDGAGDAGDTGGGSLVQRLGSSEVTIPAGVKPGDDNFRVWGQSSLNVAPVFTVPLANCGSLVCVTTGTGDSVSGTSEAYVAVLDPEDKLVRTLDLGPFECRGLAAEPDGHFAALLWVNGAASDCVDPTKNGRIYVKRYDMTGAPSWSTELVNPGSDPNCPTDWSIGESRLEFGGGKYGAYYHVHSQSGHEGDTLKYLDLSGSATTQWDWGCSHSMSNALRFNPSEKNFVPVCVTDCYPGTSGSDFAVASIGGLYTDNQNKVIDINAGCNGSVAGELGGVAPAPTGWKAIFNSHENPATPGQSSYDPKTMNQDIGFASIASSLTSGPVVWLTNTPLVNEADSTIERWQPSGDATEQYVVGWSEPGSVYVYKVARLDAKGAFLEGPVDVTAQTKWGRRDDPFRAHFNADVVWSWFAAPGDTTMHVARLRSGGSYQCASF
jgi:hypothetical protein